jgi:hypothetical protein
MSLWRIRVVVPDDPDSLIALTDVLAAQPVIRLRMMPGAATMTSDMVVELPQDDGLGAVLCALHEISPQVFVSRTAAPGPASWPTFS